MGKKKKEDQCTMTGRERLITLRMFEKSHKKTKIHTYMA